jgi:anti-sigma B factor antagonist
MLSDLQLRPSGDVLTARLTGDVDMSNGPELAAAIMQATSNHALGVVLDLSEVDYLDSAGIHLIYRLRESLRVRGQELAIVIPKSSPVNDALRLAGLERFVEGFETPDDALARLKPR